MTAGDAQPLSTAEQLQRHWAPTEPALTKVLNAALILCADHELNASAFTARCVASTGATLYGAIIGALAALQGYKHGGMTKEVARFLREATDAPTQTVREHLQRGSTVPGFGHRLYETGDPRATALLEVARQSAPTSPVWQTVDPLLALVAETTQQRPNIDFALVVMAQSLDLPALAPFALFALGRAVGWIAHSAEQYKLDRLIRPRADYNGRAPRRH
jgi:citrate synthase